MVNQKFVRSVATCLWKVSGIHTQFGFAFFFSPVRDHAVEINFHYISFPGVKNLFSRLQLSQMDSIRDNPFFPQVAFNFPNNM